MVTNNSIKNNEQYSGGLFQNGNSINLESLINRVKDEDARNLRISRSFQWTYIAIIFLYVALILLESKEEFYSTRTISNVFFILSFIAFSLIFRNGYKEFKSIDYSLPVIEMLRKTAKRYSLSAKKYLTLSIPIILMDVGLTISVYERLQPIDPLSRVLVIQVVYIPVMVISALIGLLVWRKKQKPLRDNALKLIEELEGE
ncbi:MAG: hypothetical protein HXX16_08970 [Bacteroidales bacterium]|nr:hypothetical protein [Bacteroidales bacterium]